MQVHQRKRLLTLFLLTVCLTLIVMIVVFSLVFQNVMFNFNTRIPDTAPNPLEKLSPQGQSDASQNGGLTLDNGITPRVNAPGDAQGQGASTSGKTSSGSQETPPSDDAGILPSDTMPATNAPSPSDDAESALPASQNAPLPSLTPKTLTPQSPSAGQATPQEPKRFKTERSTLQIQPPSQKAGIGQLPTNTPSPKPVAPAQQQPAASTPPLPSPPLPKP
jgi:hypothetical protein